MERKQLRILEANENAILGQEASFGWVLKGRETDRSLLWLKSHRYTFEREERERTPFEKEKEHEWDRLFHEWKDLFLFRKWPWTVFVNLLALLFVVAGVVLYIVSNFVPEKLGLLVAAVLSFLLGLAASIVNLVLMRKQLGRVKELDAIARAVRERRLLEEQEKAEKKEEEAKKRPQNPLQ